MVTERDIANMHRKIKRSKNPKTLAKYQIQIDAWIAELAAAQAQAQANILALEEKIKLEEEAKAHQVSNLKQGDKTPVALPGIATEDSSKRVAKKIAEKAGPRKCYNYFEFERFHLRRSRF